jgi:hypothetical protein
MNTQYTTPIQTYQGIEEKSAQKAGYRLFYETQLAIENDTNGEECQVIRIPAQSRPFQSNR